MEFYSLQQAALALGVSRTSLYYRFRRLNITPVDRTIGRKQLLSITRDELLAVADDKIHFQ